MSLVMEQAMDYEDMGLATGPEKMLCSNHISDTGVKKFIKKNSSEGVCDYCGRNKNVVSLEELMYFLMETVGFFYQDPVDFSGYNQGYTVDFQDGWEILTDELGLEIESDELLDDIYNSIDFNKAWADAYAYYEDGPEYRIYSWNHFKHLVKHEVRYMFPGSRYSEFVRSELTPEMMLAEIGKLTKKFKLFTDLSSGTILHRSRQHSTKERIHNVKQICAPETQYTKNANRMTPAGISMFYAAFDSATALKETLDTTNKRLRKYTIAQFATKEEICVIDLSKHKFKISPFDIERRDDYFGQLFLSKFINDLTKPIDRDYAGHIEYVPTQIVTEYFRHVFNIQMKTLKALFIPI